MGKRFDLLVFDWDGTVVDSAGHITQSLQSAAADLDLPIPSDVRARHIIGLGLVDALTFLFPELPSDQYPELAERYRHHYLAGDHKVQLFPGAHDFILRLENGYETEVQERGSRLSLGQRQLIALARALLADPGILILDEATSSVDIGTERKIESVFDLL